MQPIKDKSLFYFILHQKEGIDFEFNEKKGLLSNLKKSDGGVLVTKFMTKEILYEENGVLKSEIISPQTFEIPLTVKYIEKVISLHGYQNSVQFTLGNSKVKSEREKYLVGIELNLAVLEHQVDRIKTTCPQYNLSFNDFVEIYRIKRCKYSVEIPLMNYTVFNVIPGHEISFFEKILGHAGNKQDVCDFSYDDNFKYYTLL